jgi:hypothetical protein
MTGSAKYAALANERCCACEQFLREHWPRLHKSGLSAHRRFSQQNAALYTNGRNDGPHRSILRWW